jgi:hypothetical protein
MTVFDQLPQMEKYAKDGQFPFIYELVIHNIIFVTYLPDSLVHIFTAPIINKKC